MIILNEKKEAERIIKEGNIGKSPSLTLSILARYYRQVKKYTEHQVYKELIFFMTDYYKGFKSSLWEGVIEMIAKKSDKYQLKEIEYIGITQTELDTIESVDMKYQKLLFTLLCLAKYGNVCNEANNNWTNQPYKDIMRISRTKVKYARDKELLINDLVNMGLITLNKKNDKHNFKVLFVDDSDDYVLKITDFRELGYEWLKYLNEHKFIRCAKCGILTTRNSNRHKYCSKCSIIEHRNKVKYNMRSARM